jgi:hypothetical protein
MCFQDKWHFITLIPKLVMSITIFNAGNQEIHLPKELGKKQKEYYFNDV